MECDDIDNWLSRRAAPPPAPSNLAERIIHAAITALPERRAGFWADLMGMIVLPHPSVAVASGIILGLLVGMQAVDGLSMLQQDWSSFLDINEGGWL